MVAAFMPPKISSIVIAEIDFLTAFHTLVPALIVHSHIPRAEHLIDIDILRTFTHTLK